MEWSSGVRRGTGVLSVILERLFFWWKNRRGSPEVGLPDSLLCAGALHQLPATIWTERLGHMHPVRVNPQKISPFYRAATRYQKKIPLKT